MNGVTRRMTQFAAVLAFVFVLIGLSAQLASAVTVDSGPARSPEEERNGCLSGGGTWTTEHNGAVGICTYPNGDQDRCRFKTTGRCSITFRFDEPTPAPTKPTAPSSTGGAHNLSHDGAKGAPETGGAIAASGITSSSIDE